MDWHRVKTLLLILLVIVNGYLAYELYDNVHKQDYISESYVKQASETLKSRGIYISEDDIPRKNPTEPIVIATDVEKNYADFAARLAGETKVMLSVTQTGRTYTFGDKMLTLFRDGTFEYTASQTGKIEKTSRRRAQSLTRTFIEIAGLSSADFKITESGETEQGFSFTVQRYKNKLPIEDYITEVEIIGKKVVSAKGKLLAGASESDIATDFSDSVNVLFAIAGALGDKEMNIDSMELTYIASDNYPETAFTPMYVIETDEYKFKYDLSTGQIIE